MKSKRLHYSWIITLFCVGLVVGAASIAWLDNGDVRLLIFGAIAFLPLIFSKRILLVMVGALLVGSMVGALRSIDARGNTLSLQKLIGDTVTIEGVVGQDPLREESGEVRFLLEKLIYEGRQIGGSLWVSIDDVRMPQRSDTLKVAGRLSDGFGTITASLYDADVVQLEKGNDAAREARDSFAEEIRKVVREPEASLGTGFLLGQKSALPEKLYEELRLLGLTHIVVASGYNLTILVRFARRFGMKISRFTAFAGSLLLMFGFIQITGFSPSMTRAGIVTLLSLTAWYFGRKFHPVTLLSIAAATTVLLRPSYAWGDIGWLLSFLSFGGVILLAPLLNAYFWGEAKPSWLRQVILETVSAQILTVPLVLFVFGQFSSLALFANLFVVPLIPLVMFTLFISVPLGFMIPALGQFFGFLSETILRYMTFIITKLAESAYASVDLVVGWTFVITAYTALIVTLIFLWRRTGYSFRDYSLIE